MSLLLGIGLALALAALLSVALLWAGARRDAAALRTWQHALLRQLGQATAGPPPTPADAADAVARIVAARDAAVAMAAAAPSAVAAAGAPVPTRSHPDTGTEISRLRATQSTGTAAGDARIIEQDSRAAWTGWK
ncbi:hypothetical protein [Sphingomonas montana]|uniref:hypothetical protein n=1 Tax=Sphingomonas montana TaxID=1843236 RepID=UPI00101ADAFD|nr:hypothetical protein [Sphingomonas montana]